MQEARDFPKRLERLEALIRYKPTI